MGTDQLGRRPSADEIIRLLESWSFERQWDIEQIRLSAPILEIASALRTSTRPAVRYLLCSILGERADAAAIPVLTEALQDVSRRVRKAAASALAEIEAFQDTKLDASEIIRLLDEEIGWGPNYRKIAIRASTNEVIAAIKKCSSYGIRNQLCYLLGKRWDETAVPALIDALSDASPEVRATAADSLGRIGSPSAGEAVFRHFEREEEDDAVRRELAATLGSVDYRPAIPALIQALDAPELRASAAWALGRLKAVEAESALQRALASETDDYTTGRIKEALAKIRKA
jgi:HEAT repeat protein